MKKLLTTATISLSILGLAACSSTNANPILVESKYGNITQDDYEKKLANTADKAVILEQMIQEKLLKENFTVTKEEINKELKVVKDSFHSEEEFKSALTTNGLESENDLKEQLELKLLQQKAITDGVKADEKALKEYFNKNKQNYETAKAKHILVNDEVTAKEVKEKLDDGEDFEKLAKQKSVDTASALEGGDLGEFKRSEMIPAFSEVAFSIELNKPSDITKTDYGYHIILTTERKQHKYEEVKEEVKNDYLLANSKDYAKVIEDLKKKSNLKYKDKEIEKQINQGLSNLQGQ